MSTNFKNHDRNLKDTRGFRNSKKWKSNFKDLDSSPLRLPMRKHGRQIWCYRDTRPSSWIVSKWLKSKIGKNLDKIYSDYLQKVDPGMSEIKDTFWDLIEDSKESIKLGRSGFYKTPDNTLGYHKNPVPPYRTPDRSDEYWNLKNGPGHKSYQRLSRGSESGPVFFGKLKINHELKDVFLISKTIWHDANLPDKTYLEFPDKFYQGLLHDYKTTLVPGYHRGLIKKDDSKWSTSGIAEECNYLFLVKR